MGNADGSGLAMTASDWKRHAINAKRRANEYAEMAVEPDLPERRRTFAADQHKRSLSAARFYLGWYRIEQHNRDRARL